MKVFAASHARVPLSFSSFVQPMSVFLFILCVSFLGLPLQSIGYWGASTTEMCYLVVSEAGSLKSRHPQGWLLLRARREGTVPGHTPRLVHDHFLLVSLHIVSSLCVSDCVQISPFYPVTLDQGPS